MNLSFEIDVDRSIPDVQKVIGVFGDKYLQQSKEIAELRKINEELQNANEELQQRIQQLELELSKKLCTYTYLQNHYHIIFKTYSRKEDSE